MKKYCAVFVYMLLLVRCDSDVESDAVCGNGKVELTELCDDGNLSNTDLCSDSCEFISVCGNGIVESNESCDDGNTESGDLCNSDCSLGSTSTQVDFQIPSLFYTGTATTSATVMLHGQVHNAGGATSATSVASIILRYGSDSFANFLGVATIPPLQPGGTYNTMMPVTLPSAPCTGAHFIQMAADWNNDYDESDELNNEANTDSFSLSGTGSCF